MNWLDIVIIVGLVISLLIGLKMGLIHVLFLLVGVIVGVILAGQYSGSLAAKLTIIPDAGIAGIVAFIIIMVATLLVAMLLAFIIRKIFKAALLGWLDRVGGAVLGVLMGAIFIGAILAMWLRFVGNVDAITGSALAKFLVDKFGIVLGLLPSEFDGVRSFFH
jgi:membrane protein required for colicin V production